MSYSTGEGSGPVCGDISMDAWAVLRSTGCTLSSADAARIVSPATQYLVAPLGTNAAKGILPIGSLNTFVAQGYIGLSALPSSAMGLISAETQGGNRHVRINTSGQLEFYDGAGNQTGLTSTRTISTTGMTHVMISIDVVTGGFTGASGSWVQVWIDGVLDIWGWANLSLSGALVWGEWLPAATNRGADLYLSHITARSGSSGEQDVPGIALDRYPLLKACGGSALPPTAAGTHTAWTGTYTEVDEYPNDGAASFIVETTASDKETYKYSAANPVSSSESVAFVVQRAVHRNVGVKNSGYALYRDASGNEATTIWTIPGNTFIGNRVFMSRPAGGSWVYSDFDLSGGVSNLQFGVQAAASSANEEVTSLPGPEIWKYDPAALMEPGRHRIHSPMPAYSAGGATMF